MNRMIIVAQNGIEVSLTSNESGCPATVANKTDNEVFIEFPADGLMETLVVPARDSVGVSDRQYLDAFEKGDYIVVNVPQISMELVEARYRDGTITLIKNPNIEIGTVCQIGNLWFRFGDERAIVMAPNTYIQRVPELDIIQSIHKALEEMRQDESLLIEYVYYAHALENGTESKLESFVRLVEDLLDRGILSYGIDRRYVSVYMTDMEPPETEGWVQCHIVDMAWDLACRAGEFDEMSDALKEIGVDIIMADNGHYDHLDFSRVEPREIEDDGLLVLPEGYGYIREYELNRMLAEGKEGSYEPRGRFIVDPGTTNDKDHWTAVDNSTGHAWVENFDTLEDAFAWLAGSKPLAESLDGESESEENISASEHAHFASVLAAYINADAEEAESAYALKRARQFGLSDAHLRALGLSWLLDLEDSGASL